jgi:hypothetical protein
MFTLRFDMRAPSWAAPAADLVWPYLERAAAAAASAHD